MTKILFQYLNFKMHRYLPFGGGGGGVDCEIY